MSFGVEIKKTYVTTNTATDSYNQSSSNAFTFDSSGQKIDYGSPSLSLAMGGSSLSQGVGDLKSYLPWVGAAALALLAFKLWKGKG